MKLLTKLLSVTIIFLIIINIWQNLDFSFFASLKLRYLERKIEQKSRKFQRISSESSNEYVYSAFITIDSKEIQLKVIGFQYLSWNYQASLYDRNFQLLNTLNCYSMELFEQENHDIKAILIICDITGILTDIYLPKYAVINKDNHQEFSNVLTIYYISLNSSHETDDDFALCIPPLHNNYNDINQIIEFFAINILLGANHFYFYNFSMGNKVEWFIQKMFQKNLITVIPWNLPDHSFKSGKYYEYMKYYGQMGMIQDCLLRTSKLFQYAIFTDLDEYIIPRQYRNWRELLQYLTPTPSSLNGVFIFRNVFYENKLPTNSTKLRAIPMPLQMFRRSKYIFPPYKRSKLIVNPKKVRIMGVHQIWDSLVDPNESIDPDEGLCHHYRHNEDRILEDGEFIEDRNLLRLQKEIMDNFQEIKTKYKGLL